MACIILDCETLESGWQSLASIVDVGTEDLKQYFFKLGKRKSREELMASFSSRYSVKPIEKICWFHLTRVRPDEQFNEGLLPSSDCIDRIWQNIFYCLEDTPHCEVLQAMRCSGDSLDNYRSKLRDITREISGHNDNGPYGFVVPPNKSKFFNYPELTQWICKDYRRYTGEDITSYIYRGLVPRVIKFWMWSTQSQQDDQGTAIRAVINHLHKNIFSESDPAEGRNCCYVGNGKAIPYEQIIKIYSPPPSKQNQPISKAKAILTPLVNFRDNDK